MGKKSVALLAGGAILVGAFIQFGMHSIVPTINYSSATEMINESMVTTQESANDLNAHIEMNESFVKIEPHLKPSLILGEALPEDSASEYRHTIENGFGSQLIQLIPAYDEYTKALENRDEIANDDTSTNRGMNYSEFKSTCDLVENWKKGHQVGDTFKNGNTVTSGMAGYTPANYEVLLKGCGDDKLEFLDDLKKVEQIRLKEQVESDRLWEAAERIAAEENRTFEEVYDELVAEIEK